MSNQTCGIPEDCICGRCGIDMSPPDYPGEYNEAKVLYSRVEKLELQLGKKDREIAQLKKDKKIYLDRALLSEADIGKVQKNLDSLTAEKSRYLRRIKREEMAK